MPIDVSDLRSTIVPKSDQLNAEQLLGGPMTITVSDVRVGSSDEQPISVHYQGENGRPFKPCKTMRKVLIFAWGPDGRDWVGRSMTLYNDPQVRFGGAEVGGIRISHLTDIDRDIEVSLTATKGKKALHRIRLLQHDTGPALADVLAMIAAAHNKQTMDAAKAVASTLKNGADIQAAQAAYKARVTALRAQAKPSLADFTARVDEAQDAAAAQAAVDEAAKVLSDADMAVLREQFDIAWKDIPDA